jgi:uncharacterized protein (TIRG00374 family)
LNRRAHFDKASSSVKNRSFSLGEVFLGLLLLMLLYMVFRDVPLTGVWTVLQRAHPIGVLGLLLFNGLLTLLLANRWWLILRGLGLQLPYTQIASYRLIGATVSLLTPGPQLGGEPAQIHLLTRQGVALPTAIASVTLEKTLELIANFGFLVVSTLFVLGSGIFRADLGWSAPVLSSLLLALPVALLAVLWRGSQPVSALLYWIGKGMPARVQRRLLPYIGPAVHLAEREIHLLLRRQPGTVLMALAASLVNWLVLVAEYWLATWLLQMNLSFSEVITMLVAARLAFLLPVPGGLGTLEASQIFTLLWLGHDPAAGVGLSLLMRIRDLTLITAGIFLAWRNGWFRRRRPHVQPVEKEHHPELSA